MIDPVRTEEDLIRDEGLRLKTYRCKNDVLTIGVGHAVLPQDNISEGDSISLERAGKLLAQDIAIAWNGCVKIFGLWDMEQMPEPRQRALVNMCFQLGETKLRGFKEMIKAVLQRDWQKAHDECLDSKYAKKDSPGRASRVARVLLTGRDA